MGATEIYSDMDLSFYLNFGDRGLRLIMILV